MNQVSFFTPIVFYKEHRSTSEAIFQAVDGYLSFGSKQACVIATPIDGERGVATLSQKAPIVSGTLKLVSLIALSYFSIVIPLIALAIKVGFRIQYQFNLIDPTKLNPEAELKKGIPIELQEQIQNMNHANYITSHTQVYRLKSTQGFILKMNTQNPSAIYEQFQNRIEAKRVCMMHQLNRVKIPQACLIQGTKTSWMIEQELSIQREAVHPKTLRQITTFILKTGLDPIRLEKDEKALEKLISSLDCQEQIDIVLSEVKRQCNAVPECLQKAKTNRIQAIAFQGTAQNLPLQFGFTAHL